MTVIGLQVTEHEKRFEKGDYRGGEGGSLTTSLASGVRYPRCKKTE